MKQVAQELQKEAHLYKIGEGGAMFDQIKWLQLAFLYYEPLDEDQARKLLIYAVDKLVTAVNANQKIRPYLANDPFTPKNVKIGIALFKSDGSTCNFGDLSFVASNQGKLKYIVEHPDPFNQEIWKKETYDEAVAKIATEFPTRPNRKQIR